MIENIKDIDPGEITDVKAYQDLQLTLMNIIESQSNLIATLRKELEDLKDELDRIKG